MSQKKKVVIYSRVSTDEQKENGYSLQEQEARLRKHCAQNDWEVVEHFQDDHSAKNFNRPDYKRMVGLIKAKKLRFHILLVTRIDRFSRDVYETFKQLEFFKLNHISLRSIQEGVMDFHNSATFFPNIIQQAAAQYDNLVKGDNTKRGMRQCAREGRWPWRAPMGYKNDTLRKTIEIDEGTKPLIIEAFELMSTGAYAAEEVRKILAQKGLKCSKNNFINILRNSFYIGKVYIPAWKDEKEEIIIGIHKPLISESLFKEVQAILNGNRKKISINVTRKEALPLRSLLSCRRCGSKLTGSPSRSRNGSKYYYYHCQRGCKERFRADLANHLFIQYLQTFDFREEVLELFFELLKERFKQDDGEREQARKTVEIQIETIKKRQTSLTEKYLDDQLSSKDYNEIKNDLEEKYGDLTLQHTLLGSENKEFSKQINYALSLLSDLAGYYEKAPLAVKQKLVGSIFSEKLIFSENNYRTTKINEVMRLISLVSRDSAKKPLGKKLLLTTCPVWLPDLGSNSKFHYIYPSK